MTISQTYAVIYVKHMLIVFWWWQIFLASNTIRIAHFVLHSMIIIRSGQDKTLLITALMIIISPYLHYRHFLPRTHFTLGANPPHPANPHRKALASETLASELHLYNWHSSFKSQNLCKFQLIIKSWGWVSYYFVLLSISVALSHFDFFEIE